MIDDELRQHLHERSHDVPDIDAMRDRVRTRLDRESPTTRGRSALIACGVAAAFAVVVFALRPDDESEVTDVAAERPGVEFEMATAPPQGPTFIAADMAVRGELTRPAGAGAPQVVNSRPLPIPPPAAERAPLPRPFPSVPPFSPLTVPPLPRDRLPSASALHP